MRKNDEELVEMYSLIKDKVKVGGLYAHYKHPEEALYQVQAIGMMEDTWQPLVTYKHLKSGICTVHTLDNFLKKVEINGLLVDRFKLVS
jgi:hypothetical protein